MTAEPADEAAAGGLAPASRRTVRQAVSAWARRAPRTPLPTVDPAELARAVSSDRVTGAAIGLLMGARDISEAEAFDLLRSTRRRTDRALRDVAADVVRRGATIGGGSIAAP